MRQTREDLKIEDVFEATKMSNKLILLILNGTVYFSITCSVQFKSIHSNKNNTTDYIVGNKDKSKLACND